MTSSYRARSWRGWRPYATWPEVEREEILGEWIFRDDKLGCWRGWHEDGRKTPLKVSLRAAQEDALNNRCVCPKWPHCEHPDVDFCCQQALLIRAPAQVRREQWR